MDRSHYTSKNGRQQPYLVDVFLRSEALLECRLAGLALCQPQVIARSAVRPEIDLGAKEFFAHFDRRKEEIIEADELTAIKIAYSCCSSGRDFDRFFASTRGLNAFETAPKFGAELIAMRTARKAVRWLEESGLAHEVVKEVMTYA